MNDARQPDVVCLSSNDWTALPTSKHHLMSVLSRRGRVLYVDPPMDLASVLGRARRWPKLRRLRQVEGGLWVLSDISLVHPPSPRARAERCRRAAARIEGAARRCGLSPPVVWAFSPEHAACKGLLGERLLVYHAADDPASMSRHPEETAALEESMLDACDLVFVSSQALLEARGGRAPTHRLPNAADRAHYARVLCGDPAATADALASAAARPGVRPRGLPPAGRPVVMYGGAAYGWFDWDLLLRVAAMRQDWAFVLVGPVSARVRPGALSRNVLLAGRRPYEEFPWHVAAASAMILPWRDGPFSRHADPIVLYEALLCGKPVVTTPFPAALERGGLVRTAAGPEAFAAALDAAVAEPPGEGPAAERVRFGFGNTWEHRAAAALAIIGSALASRRRRGPTRNGGS
ncbi:MAG: glycosyltransferase [Candidatus Eisenbacteria bacterium]|nr:glycosyltransferase [Candidatus Eisenbacteria bacterium]